MPLQMKQNLDRNYLMFQMTIDRKAHGAEISVCEVTWEEMTGAKMV